jgi:hypothetical protein
MQDDLDLHGREQPQLPAEEPAETLLDQRLRSLEQAAPPHDLLERCLATIGAPAESEPSPRPRPARWPRRLAAAAAALLLLGALAVLARPRNATAAHFLQAVRASWTEVPACHTVVERTWPGQKITQEAWFVRGKGGRMETRSPEGRVGVVINNGRWEFRWDVPGHLVAAWSVPLLGQRSEFARAGLIENSESLLRWAETHQADIHIEPDRLDGRTVRKVTLRWPGPGGAGSPPQVDTVWFDPDSLLPVRHRMEIWDGGVANARFDYPAPENVPSDLFAFQPPRDVTLEVNDPDLGRQIYADALDSKTASHQPQGADR